MVTNFLFLLVKIFDKIIDGTLVISFDNTPIFIITFFKKKIIVEIVFYTENIFGHEKQNFFHNLTNTKKFAQLLAENGMTIVILYKKKEIIILGKDANPKISKVFTRSKHIEIKNFNEIMKVLKK